MKKLILMSIVMLLISGCVDETTGGNGSARYYSVFMATVDGVSGVMFDAEFFVCNYGYAYEVDDQFNTLYGNDLVDITCHPDITGWYEWGDIETSIFNISEIPAQ